MTGKEPQELKSQAEKEILSAQTGAELSLLKNKYLGPQGQVRQLFKDLKGLPEIDRKSQGLKINRLQQELLALLARKTKQLAVGATKIKEVFDLDKPGLKPPVGRLHPLTQTKREIISIFSSMGFDIAQGPEVEDEWHNFDALNIPKEHPARDAWNTIWIKNPESPKPKAQPPKLLLRTHTSPVQARYLMTHQPPLRMIVPGKVFRYEATDVRHEAQFYQLEGLMVDRRVSAANFKAVVGEFLKRFFNNKNLKFRLRPDFFPFTEPSFDIAMTCLTCAGKSCPVCKKTGWLEVAGAGMVHPNVFKACGLDPSVWKGWAFGFGWDRLTMMKYKIHDIRLFNSGNLRFLEQF
jgi:phenylalanyl-tRNA synthetase alpha chain